MSKRPQALAALEVARDARARGYKSLLHSPPYREVKEWIDDKLNTGNISINELHRQAVKQFPDKKIPSLPTLVNYSKKHWVPKQVAVPMYIPDYMKAVSQFDSYLKLIESAKELWARYQEAKADEVGLGNRSVKSAIWIDRYLKTLESLLNFEIKLHIRDATQMPENLTLNQFNVTQHGPIADLEAAEGILVDTKTIQKWEEKLNALRDSRSAEAGTADKPAE